ncbi:hypothetical protein VOLCADRAFT_89222 [Volvox carteri f. nagariensis]|uniref:leucine--tRNA ligase n=1 Tax=Volvox carteri f. nagariensis TaxID=3068 RepID=D8TR45_VOLCA|nr:uncharacterized protein VOLCADRAFT_89222 [Volvox carteri f. nagariensis]EFJ50272.1 hypothetical protein VOLCADRAFT_89222 [Volvox carteri f. nagariensis]|eukprot:XP_002948892.1 hypothetical protein VOLCADRAFT_89222 [Volvox carteri f. nagariensis]
MSIRLSNELSSSNLSSRTIRPGLAQSLLLRPCSLRCKAFSVLSPFQTRGPAASGPIHHRGLQPTKAVEAVAPAAPSPASATQADAKSAASQAYPFTEIEAKWQAYWEQNQTFHTPDQVDTSKPKYYVLDMFPYPSGAGLHVGHPEGYTATDILARYKRMRGFNVLHPMGWDAFGLPAEQYALQTGTHPAVTTQRNVTRFRQQLKALGFSYDWSREISTTDPEYYRPRWQAVSLKCVSERGGYPVVRMPMKQWMLRITAYAERLLSDLELLDWPDSIKDMQRNWIGRSEGAEVRFQLSAGPGASLPADTHITVFTTRPDTLFGATYLVVAPEHPLVGQLATSEHAAAVHSYVEAASRKSDLERTELQKEKTGVDTGSFAINPATGEKVPVWVADYVLGSYGSGAIMAVPGHDVRDHEFAVRFGLPIKQVVAPADGGEVELPYTEPGVAVNSSSSALSIDGQSSEVARGSVVSWLEGAGAGSRQVNYKLRDWLFARQRYWGEPFPLVYPEGSDEAVPLPESSLPLTLPDTDRFKPSGTPESPLAAIPSWVNTVDPRDGVTPARRETSTMPQWAGSCWYYLRYISPRFGAALVDAEAEKYWMPVDLYVGGAEHAVLHLLYARFWHKVLYDLGVVSTPEPFQRLVSQGMILGEVEYTAFRDGASGEWMEEGAPGAVPVKLSESEVDKRGDGYVLKTDPRVRVSARAHKMSKSRGNVINPDDVVAQFGADSLRLYEMFMGPLRDTKVWSTRGVEGVHRFLARVWRLFEGGVSEEPPSREQLRLLHQTIKKVSIETEELRFNTAIAAMMEFVNGVTKSWNNRPRAALEPFVLLLSPYAPHLSEELWARCGHSTSLAYESWPAADEGLLVVDTVNLPVQVNGKTRGTVQVAAAASQDDAMAAAVGNANVAKYTADKEIKKVIYVPGKILNLIPPQGLGLLLFFQD